MAETVRKRVLLVDDEEEFLSTLAMRLERRGIAVHSVGTGEDAVEAAKSNTFDAIVLDLTMPGIDGLATLRLLKEVDPDPQVIMLTGNATIEAAIEAMKLGAEDFLVKPVEFEVIHRKIDAAAGRKMLLVDKKRVETLTTLGQELKSLAEIEKLHIRQVLSRASTMEEAAKILGIDPATLWRKRKRYQIE